MELNEFDKSMELLENGVPYHLQHPLTGEDLDIKLYIGSYDSKRSKKAEREYTDSISFENFNYAEQKDKLTIAIVKSAIVGWENMILDGVELECNEENKAIILDKYPFIAKQIEKIASDRSRFFFK